MESIHLNKSMTHIIVVHWKDDITQVTEVPKDKLEKVAKEKGHVSCAASVQPWQGWTAAAVQFFSWKDRPRETSSLAEQVCHLRPLVCAYECVMNEAHWLIPILIRYWNVGRFWSINIDFFLPSQSQYPVLYLHFRPLACPFTLFFQTSDTCLSGVKLCCIG